MQLPNVREVSFASLECSVLLEEVTSLRVLALCLKNQIEVTVRMLQGVSLVILLMNQRTHLGWKLCS